VGTRYGETEEVKEAEVEELGAEEGEREVSEEYEEQGSR
jgi:hypothetical protein